MAAIGLIAFLAPAAQARDRSAVANEYRLSCQACHGPLGKGDGPMARNLVRKPADLTKLEEENNYEFPYLRLFQIIDGRSVVPAHGMREMPVWGRRYMVDIGEKYGPYGGEAAVRARVLELVEYVRSLQER